MKRSITIIKEGIDTSIQDQGRSGYYHLGIPPSGALDQYSFSAANLLVGNPESAAVLECTLLAPIIHFNSDIVIAITGAEISVFINGEVVANNQAILVKAGSELKCGAMMRGARIYIAFQGGIDVPVVLGSRSFYGLGSIGGLFGKAIEAGDEIPIGPFTGGYSSAVLPPELYQTLDKEISIRVIPGLYDHLLTKPSQDYFYQNKWKVGTEANRIGYRLKGDEPLVFIKRVPPFGAGSDSSNIVDAPYPVGSIQVPGGQEPIILLRDAVSAGGYAMIATVISADMDLIGQLQPNYSINFKFVEMEEALAARHAYSKKLEELRHFFRE